MYNLHYSYKYAFEVCMFFQVFVFAVRPYLNATPFHVYRAKVCILQRNMEAIF